MPNVSQILFLIVLLWVCLAISIGFHANGHNRSTLFWSGLTLITGVFGVMIYLLFITSHGTEDPENGVKTSREFGYVFAAVGGAVIAFVSARVLIQGLSVMTLPPITDLGSRTSPLASMFIPLTLLTVISGIVAGILLYHRGGINRFLTVSVYTPAVLLGFVTTPFLISVVGEVEGIFYGGYRMALAPVALILPAILFAEAWRIVLYKMPFIGSWAEQSDRTTFSVDGRSRRKFLSLAGATTVSFVGYGLLGENPHREEQIQENKLIVPDGFELSDLSYGYFEEDDEYRVTGTVTTTKTVYAAGSTIEWYVGTGVGLGSTSRSLDLGFNGGEPAQLRAVVDTEEDLFSFEPSEIERFELEVYEGRYPPIDD